jgi:uncharacterized membrane protein YgdD (TMEM256/DUF423 family)
MPRFFALGAFAMALAVAAGAFGAHGLKARLTPDMLAHWETAVRYHAYHGLGLLAVAWAVDRGLGRGGVLAGRLMVAGMLLFSGSLYVYALTGLKAVAMVTPLGGVCFIAAWVALGVSTWRHR